MVTQCREDAFDVLPVRRMVNPWRRSDIRQPQVDVFCQRELLDGLRRAAAITLKEDCLLVEPFRPAWVSSLQWVDTVCLRGLMRLPL